MSVYLVPMVESIPSRRKHFTIKNICAFKFAGFLGLLHSVQIIWRGQAESESMRLAQRGLNYFQRADLQQKVAMLARWIRRPGPSSLCAKQDIRPARGENETRIVAAWIERRRKIGAENSLSQCGLDLFPAKPGRNSGAISL